MAGVSSATVSWVRCETSYSARMPFHWLLSFSQGSDVAGPMSNGKQSRGGPASAGVATRATMARLNSGSTSRESIFDMIDLLRE